MDGFSGAVRLLDANDFIAPAQNCIAPMMAAKDEPEKEDAAAPSNKGTAVRIEMEDDTSVFAKIDLMAPALAKPKFDQMKMKAGKKTATISLNDCLACSGCVTSAETVLIQLQSKQELLDQMRDHAHDKAFVFTIAPQTRVSLAQHFGLTPLQTTRRLTTFLRDSLGARLVLDAACALDISLLEAREEFVQRYRHRAALQASSPPAATTKASSTTTAPSSAAARLPVLTSECPGWICYAEKSEGEAVIPLISGVKSPQQVMGMLVKTFLARTQLATVAPTRAHVYHVSVAPCYDKKLEGSRDDFFDASDGGARDVDLVLTTGELRELIVDRVGSLVDVAPAATLDAYTNVEVAAAADGGDGGDVAMDIDDVDGSSDSATTTAADNNVRLARAHDVGASGGYLENVFRYAAKTLFDIDVVGALPYTQGRNPDFREVTLADPTTGAVLLRFAAAYGFRNIQNVMRKLKRGKCPYDYVEIMACPSGCLNGGGQIRGEADGAAPSIKAQKALVSTLDTLYHDDAETAVRDPADAPVARGVYEQFLNGDVGGDAARQHLHTQYHAVKKADVNPLAIQW
jgi:iron only hydrogenase large subunit-like protein